MNHLRSYLNHKLNILTGQIDGTALSSEGAFSKLKYKKSCRYPLKSYAKEPIEVLTRGTSMSSIPSTPSYGDILAQPLSALASSSRQRVSSKVLRRQPSMTQGQALEKLGRAIEYLYDSQVYQKGGELMPDDMEAVQTLMRLSREVFLQCREIVPPRRGLKQWLFETFIEGTAA